MANLKRILSLILALVMLAGVLPESTISAKAAETVGGAHGENITWEISPDGTLTLSGTGEVAMAEYDDALEALAYPWTYHKDQVTKIVIGEGITQLPNAAFADFVNATEIVLPGTLTHTQSNTFCNTGITRVELPEGMEFLGSGCFAYCEKLEYVQLPSTLTFISDWTFDSCVSLKTVVMPPMPDLEYINEGAFYGCTALTDISWYSAEILYGDLFTACTGLVDIRIPEGVTEVWSRVFNNCSNLKRVEFPESLTELGSAIFKCENDLTMDAVVFRGAVPVFESDAFSGLTATCYYPAGDPTWTEDVMQNYGGNITWVAAGAEENPSGTCGENLTWELVGGTLTISGEGYMDTFGAGYAPWYDIRFDIKKVVLPDSLMYITSGAFADCIYLEEVALPEDLYGIEGNAFRSCVSLKEITFPETLNYIGYQAFEDAALTDITITGPVIETFDSTAFNSVTATVHYPGNDTTWHEAHRLDYGGNLTWEPYEKPVTQLDAGTCGENLTWTMTSDGILTISGTGPMTNYNKIQVNAYGYRFDMPWLDYVGRIGKVIVEDGVTSIGNYAFALLTYLREVEIPDSVTAIGASAFWEDQELLRVDLPDGITEIGQETFYDCASLTDVKIPDTLANIGPQAFYNCYSLTAIDLPETLRVIGYGAFYGCSSLTEIALPEKLEQLGGGAFERCSGIRSMVIPENIHQLGTNLFYGCTSLTSVVMHDAIDRINNHAFYGCSSLTEIQIPYGVYYIDQYAFSNSGLTEITFTGAMPSFGSNVFRYLNAVVRYPANNTTWVPDGMQNYGGNLTWESYELPLAEIDRGTCGEDLTWVLTSDGKLTITGTGAMQDYEYQGAPWSYYRAAVTEVVMTRGITHIGSNAFGGFRAQELMLPDTVLSIGDHAFKNWGYLTELVLPDSVTTIGAYAFSDCRDLIKLVMSDSVTTIGNGAFTYCMRLSDITWSENLTSLGNDAFCLCSSLKQLVLPDSLTAIGNGAFQGCTRLTEVKLPNHLQVIGDYAFCEMIDLPGITIPASVTRIGDYAFAYKYDHGMEITFLGTAPEFGEYALYGSTITVYYPADDASWTSDVMQQYGGIITWTPMGGEPIGPEAPVAKASNVASTGKIKLTWGAVEGAAEYQVYRSTDNKNWSLLKTTTGTSLTNTSTTAGTLYYYYVVAVDADGNKSDPSEVISRRCDLPQPVITLSNVASTGKIKISWEAVEGAAKYEVYRSTDNETWTKLSTTTGTSLTNTSTTAGTLYYYKVKAIHENSAANSAYSAVKSKRCDLAQPVITLSNVASTGKIKITWEAVEGAAKYEVYRSTDNETWSLLKTVTGTNLTNTSTTAGTLYYYKVKAIHENSAANSAYSAVKSRRCDLAQPVITLSNVASSGKIKITWEAVEGAAKYEVYRSTDNETWTKLSTTTGTSLTNTSTTAGTLYYYKVKAIHENSAANSAYSVVKSRTCDLARPTLTVKLNTSGKPVLTWTKIEGAVKYEVYRSTDNETWTKLSTTTGTKLTNTSVVAGTTYYYKVKAIASNTAANSAYSTVKSIAAE